MSTAVKLASRNDFTLSNARNKEVCEKIHKTTSRFYGYMFMISIPNGSLKSM